MRTTLCGLALALVIACDSTSSVADDVSFDVPAGLIGKGSTVSVAIINDSEHDAQTGSLPCVVRLEQRLEGKWEQRSANGPCPGVVTPVPAGATASFGYPMPDEIGTYRLAADVTFAGGGTGTIRTRSFQTVGIAIN